MHRSDGYFNASTSGISFGRCLLTDFTEVVDYALAVRWDLRQPVSQLLMSGAGCAIVFLPGGAQLQGPNRGAKIWTVSGRSWSIVIKFQPGLSRRFGSDLVDAELPWTAAPNAEVAAHMSSSEALPPAGLNDCLSGWLEPLKEHVDEACLRVNHICRIAAADRSINSVAALAEHCGVSTRTLYNILKRATGLTPRWFIERRRMQDAIRILREQPEHSLKELAVQLGFTDQAHFGNVCRELTGVTPATLRGGWKPRGAPRA